MGALLWEWWGAIWPNLVASALWTWPVLGWHHRKIKRHVEDVVKRAIQQ